MTDPMVLEIAASSDEVNIVVWDGALWASCKRCRDAGINDFELTKKYVDWECPQCAVVVKVKPVCTSKIGLGARNFELRDWVAEWLGVSSSLVEVSIDD